jgi:hypothetical protein
MGGGSKRTRRAEFTQKESTFSRIGGLLKDPITILNNAHKRIVGWLCCYTPLEIILVAGLAPHNISPKSTSDMADFRCFKNDIIRGLHGGISKRILTMAGKQRMERPITMTGSVAKNCGIVDVLRGLLENEIHVPKEPQIIGALGAALSAFQFPSDSTGYYGERKGRT